MNNIKKTTIAIDFDGTIVTHEYPYIGRDLPYVKEVIKTLVDNGHKLFLYTMRDGDQLEDAIKYCEFNNLNFIGYNKSPQQFSTSPKQYASVYIDDAALGCPVIFDPTVSDRPYVNWSAVAKWCADRMLITYEQYYSIVNNN